MLQGYHNRINLQLLPAKFPVQLCDALNSRALKLYSFFSEAFVLFYLEGFPFFFVSFYAGSPDVEHEENAQNAFRVLP
jgi:hypothetical protein